jgi:uncharacterized protein (DUF1015 family)
MPQLLAFVGLRPDPAVTGALDEVVCPPYDIITEDERLRLLQRSPFNVVRLELPNGRYQEAAKLLAEWESNDALAWEEHPALYGYRMSYRAADGRPRQTLGVIGALVLEAPGRGILPHEQTTPKAKSDRLELIQATRANTSPIWCLCTQPGLAAALSGPAGEGAALGTIASARDDEGTLHEIWPIFDREAIEHVAKVVQAAPLLVADGHHRYETALAYQAEQSSSAPASGTTNEEPAGYDALLTLVVELSEEHLQVLAIHRVVSGLPSSFDFIGALRSRFELTPTGLEGPSLLAEMVSTGALGVVTKLGNWLAQPRPSGPGSEHDLDSSRIDAALQQLPPHQLAYEHDVAHAVAEVRSGRTDAAVLCRPATFQQIAQTAQGGQRMPPKTTFFWPKPRTGMVIRDFGATPGA